MGQVYFTPSPVPLMKAILCEVLALKVATPSPSFPHDPINTEK